jgi:hypothetical protein
MADHQDRPYDQRPATTDAIGSRGQEYRDDGVASEGESQQEADLRLAQPEGGEVEHQDDGQ